MSGGKPNTIMNAVISMYHAYSGILLIVMPGVRVFRIETISSTPAATAEISANVTPSSQKSTFGPGENCGPLSGTYMNQPPSGTAPKKKLEYSRMPPNR